MAQHMQSLQPLPAEVQLLAEAHSLGAPMASYSQRNFSSLIALIIALLSPLFFLGVSIVYFFESELLAALATLLAAAFAGGLVIYGYSTSRKQQVHIFTKGFVYLSPRRVDKIEVLRWDQIKTIWYELTDSAFWDSLRLRRTDGTALKVQVLHELRDARELYRTIEREFVRIQLPGVIAQYKAGHAIAFGELSVNQLGLTNKGETLPWSQVLSIDVSDRRVWIKKEGGKRRNWFAADVDEVPNLCLLRELVTYMGYPH